MFILRNRLNCDVGSTDMDMHPIWFLQTRIVLWLFGFHPYFPIACLTKLPVTVHLFLVDPRVLDHTVPRDRFSALIHRSPCPPR
jgi:hypothetical protein